MFKIRELGVVGYANGFTLWCYNAREDDMAAVDGVDYFNVAADMLAVGDVIIVRVDVGSAMRSVVVADGRAVIARLL